MSVATIGRQIIASLGAAEPREMPFRHWLLRDVVSASVGTAVTSLPVQPPAIADTLGKRETHNATRVFLAGEVLRRFPVCREIAVALQDDAIVAAFETSFGAKLQGSYLRVEYCQDRSGFWLEPHTDIGAKRFTMLIYLCREAGAAEWGTDLYDDPDRWVGRAPGDFARGLVFIPASNTWHGFARRPIAGIRRSLIVNYVIPQWRSRHELAFPDRPVGGTS
jgi:hypothetical protein